jgi:Tfp pilus assembly protein PilV
VRRIRAETGLTVVEVLIASVLLIVGVLGTFMMLDVSSRAAAAARAREGATNVARETLENARSVPFAQIGLSGWLQQQLQAMPNGSGTVSSPNFYTQQTTLSRRGFAYADAASVCSVDDGRDGYGDHAASVRWCSDSASTGTADGQAEDLKRVTADVSYSVNARAQAVQQTATFSASGAPVGPSVTALSITSPATYAGQASPVVTSTPAGGILSFTGTSAGAGDMKFTIDGAEQPGGATSVGAGGWRLDWSVASLKDGSYTVGATAIDALGTRGQPRTMQVVLNRGAPAALSGVTGGYNYVNLSGTRTLAVEAAWDASPEGNVTGYQVLRGASVVCATALTRSCIDTSPAATGTTTYTLRTWYRDSAGVAQSISSSLAVAAPTTGSVPSTYGFVNSTSNATTGCYPGGSRDLTSTFPTSGGTDSTLTTTAGAAMVGCMSALPAGVSLSAGTGTINAWYTNSGKKTCVADWGLVLNGNTLVEGTSLNGGNDATYSIVPSTTATQVTLAFTTAARTFAAGDVLSLALVGDASTGNCTSQALVFGSGAHQTTLTVPLTGGGGTTLAQPAPPAGLTLVHNADGSNTLSWTAPTGSPPPDFYRIYRDGQNYSNRIDTAGDGGTSTITWTDTAAGGTSHSYYVTTVAATLAESATMAGPMSG